LVQIIKGLRLHPKAALREGAEIAWAVRPDNPKLLATLNRAIAEITGKVHQWSDDTRSYLSELKQLHTATQGADMQRFRDTVEIFRDYAGQYRFDTLMLVAQGYQESNLDQRTVSRVGAVGLMQIMPQTGRELGVGDIHKPDPNVHAGAKYMAQLMDDYFNDAVLDQAKSNRCGAKRRRKISTRTCGSTMSSGWRQRGSARNQCDMCVTSTNITSPIS
jgi:membrane-bound lytic murein transglycosylase MltF